MASIEEKIETETKEVTQEIEKVDTSLDRLDPTVLEKLLDFSGLDNIEKLIARFHSLSALLEYIQDMETESPISSVLKKQKAPAEDVQKDGFRRCFLFVDHIVDSGWVPLTSHHMRMHSRMSSTLCSVPSMALSTERW